MKTQSIVIVTVSEQQSDHDMLLVVRIFSLTMGIPYPGSIA